MFSGFGSSYHCFVESTSAPSSTDELSKTHAVVETTGSTARLDQSFDLSATWSSYCTVGWKGVCREEDATRARRYFYLLPLSLLSTLPEQLRSLTRGKANPSQIAGSGKSREGLPFHDSNQIAPLGETLVQMYDVCVRYGDKPALGNWKQNVDGVSREGLWWTIRRGERWGVFGPNGV